MDELSELYQEIILDHNKNPRNFGKLENANRLGEGQNQLCGDHYRIYLLLEGNSIKDIRFEGAGCAISKASCSVMTSVLKGKTIQEAEELFNLFHKIVTGEKDVRDHLDELGKLVVFAGVAEFPLRVKCAILPWHAMHSALASGDDEVVSTE